MKKQFSQHAFTLIELLIGIAIIAVAAALLSDKDVLVFDEPTSGLDHRHMLAVGNMIRTLNEKNKVILVVSHDVEFLSQTCDKILSIEGGWTERR